MTLASQFSSLQPGTHEGPIYIDMYSPLQHSSIPVARHRTAWLKVAFLAAVCPKKVVGKLLGVATGASFFVKVSLKASNPRSQGRSVAFWTVKLGDTGAAACPRLFCQAMIWFVGRRAWSAGR